MVKEDFKLDATVEAKLCDGSTKQGVLKGLYKDSAGKVQVTVQYEQPVENTFDLENVT